MGSNLSELLALIIIGVIFAYVIANVTKTNAVFTGLAELWAKITNGLLG